MVAAYPPKSVTDLTGSERNTLAKHASGSSQTHDTLLETLQLGFVVSCVHESCFSGSMYRLLTKNEGHWLISSRAFRAIANLQAPLPVQATVNFLEPEDPPLEMIPLVTIDDETTEPIASADQARTRGRAQATSNSTSRICASMT